MGVGDALPKVAYNVLFLQNRFVLFGFSAQFFEHHCQTAELITMVLCCKIASCWLSVCLRFFIGNFYLLCCWSFFFYCEHK